MLTHTKITICTDTSFLRIIHHCALKDVIDVVYIDCESVSVCSRPPSSVQFCIKCALLVARAWRPVHLRSGVRLQNDRRWRCWLCAGAGAGASSADSGVFHDQMVIANQTLPQSRNRPSSSVLRSTVIESIASAHSRSSPCRPEKKKKVSRACVEAASNRVSHDSNVLSVHAADQYLARRNESTNQTHKASASTGLSVSTQEPTKNDFALIHLCCCWRGVHWQVPFYRMILAAVNSARSVAHLLIADLHAPALISGDSSAFLCDP